MPWYVKECSGCKTTFETRIAHVTRCTACSEREKREKYKAKMKLRTPEGITYRTEQRQSRKAFLQANAPRETIKCLVCGTGHVVIVGARTMTCGDRECKREYSARLARQRAAVYREKMKDPDT
jgi:hypothetical protein